MPTRILIPFVLAVFALAYALQSWVTGDRAKEAALQVPPMPARLVSMAPSITEMVYALGLGNRLVGVTRYCEFPPEAKKVTETGGFLDPNYEVVMRLEPDLVILLAVHAEAKQRFKELGIPTLEVDHRTLDGILDSIAVIGKSCGTESSAAELLSEIESRLEYIESQTRDLERPRVLLSAGRGIGSGRITEVHAAGKNQWYDDVIRMAGGKNAFTNEAVQFPTLTGEGLLHLNPDVIIEMIPELDETDHTAEDLVADWNSLDELTAVKNGDVHILTGDYVTIPGPRVIRVVEDIARVLHPGLELLPK